MNFLRKAAKIVFINSWKVAGAFVRPKGITKYS
jgi:hypothetical protein